MLNLDGNKITDSAAEAIAHAVLTNPNTVLTDMDLGYHHFCVPDLTKPKKNKRSKTETVQRKELQHNCNKEGVKQSPKTRKVLDDAMAKARKNYSSRRSKTGTPARMEL